MICAATYIIVGIFGYVALSHTDLGGNVLTAYEPSMIIRVIKIGFGISVALSFPLVIFPCRTAIHSLLFPKPGYSAPLDMATANYITPNRYVNHFSMGSRNLFVESPYGNATFKQ